MKHYTYATVLCACGRQVGRVPPAPGRKACACGLRLYFVQKGEGLQPFADDTYMSHPPRAWNSRKLRILRATEAS